MDALSHPKILSLREFLHKRASLPPGFRLVFTNGCYDILHPGHVDLLARARALGDGLVLGLNSDASVRRIKGELSGPPRPVNSERERAFVLAGLASVDFVVLFDEDTPLELITAIRPQVLVKGGDWDLSRIVGREVVEADGGRVLSLPLLPGYSTTALIERLTSAQGKAAATG
ncbi:rfaE bifunctional protein, domain II [Humidesulfovibrio mexicanus]|uniref:D-glycero-beta-D-manno-heptose 1-phosphate adenylyltransferase n=1 Tax=Humidesulfovibrio mexicanus TaxID=147047 RepID=A0A239BXT8_9BACT|nr:D-glycero-beta-D-manno-heptose 1-phosphate adenylyltransferase [Humidesulfovibrio mexicanus]SNS12469.1 rfaE bifunctional protein, domain II [Humidesulfovibrio mexicanus]